MQRFSQGDVDKLRSMASLGHPAPSIAAALNRTPQAIRLKAGEMGIQLHPALQRFTADDIAKLQWMASLGHPRLVLRGRSVARRRLSGSNASSLAFVFALVGRSAEPGSKFLTVSSRPFMSRDWPGA